MPVTATVEVKAAAPEQAASLGAYAAKVIWPPGFVPPASTAAALTGPPSPVPVALAVSVTLGSLTLELCPAAPQVVLASSLLVSPR